MPSIFQPRLTDINTPTYVQQGVVDTSAAQAITAAGKTAIEAYQGYEEAKLETEVEGIVSDLFEAKATKFESDRPVEKRIEDASSQAFQLSEEGFGAEDPAVQEMSQSLKRLQRAKNLGSISELEFKARVQDAVKRSVDRLPGHSETLREIGSTVLGDNSARIDMIFAKEKEQDALQKAALKGRNQHLNRVAEFKGIDPTTITPTDEKDYAIHQQAKANAERLKQVDANTLRTTGEKVNHYGQIGTSLVITTSKGVGDALNSTLIKGKSVAEYRREFGEQALVKAIAEDETAKDDLKRNLSAQVDLARTALNNHYALASKESGLNITQFDDVRASQSKILDDYDRILKSDLDSGQLNTLFTITNLKNKTNVEKVFATAHSLAILRATGGIREVTAQYFTDKESVTRLYGAQIGNDLELAFGGQNQALSEQVTDNTIQFAEGNVTLEELQKTSPISARISHVQAREHIRLIKQEGFKSNIADNVRKQKDTFVTFSKAIVNSIDPRNPNSLKVLHEQFGDARYQTLLQELDAPQREQISAELLNKYDNIIGSKQNSITLLGRIEKATARFVERESATMAGKFIETAGAPTPKVTIEGGKLVSNVEGNKLASNVKELILGTTREEYQDHVTAVATLNKMLEGKYNAVKTFERVGTYQEFLRDFHTTFIKGNGPQAANPEPKQEEPTAPPTPKLNSEPLKDGVYQDDEGNTYRVRGGEIVPYRDEQ